ncbi:MAG TPA: sugar porter family MFS transporter [Verrucomicrobiae bacterium]|jgi:SP family arabinose:H+ symporter-like MFS transporter|nr:sugar porter family MFS transporter [Verrucomicrobiae bacterium]
MNVHNTNPATDKIITERPAVTRERTRYVFAIAFTAAVGGFLFGYDLSLIGAANIFLKAQFHLSAQALGFTTASAALGCVFGPFLGGWLCDAIGRERTMIISSLLLALGAIMTAFSQNIILFNAFRILGGVGVGLCSVASPMYISEVAPRKMRGKLGMMYQLAIVVGSTAAPLVAYVLVRMFPDSVSWRWMFGSQMVVVVLFMVFLFLLPPSPRWLAQKGRFEEAFRVLNRIHGEAEAPTELQEIKGAIEEEAGGLKELFLPGIRYAVLIGFLLAFFNNWTGWSVMGGYIPILFEMAGVQQHAAILQFSFTYLAMALMTVVSMYTIDRVGRRPLWILASILMACVTGLTGLVFASHAQGWPVLVVIILCTVPHGIALGGLPWLMMSELFPNRIRAKAVAVTTTFLWLTIFTAAQLFPILIEWSQHLIGSAGGAFWLFTVVCICSAIFGWRMMPETKGRTLEEIGRSWRGH